MNELVLYEILKKITIPCLNKIDTIKNSDKEKVIKQILKNSSWHLINIQEEDNFILFSRDIELIPDKKYILISSHIDTVKEMNPCFSCDDKATFLFGTYDNSITNAAALYNMINNEFNENVLIAFTGNEEYGMRGARDVCSRLSPYHIERVIILDVTYEEYYGMDFTFDNCHHSKSDIQIFRKIATEQNAKYCVNEIMDDDESLIYSNRYYCMSLCIPVKGDMHSHEGVCCTKASLEKYISVLELLANTEIERITSNGQSFGISAFLSECKPIFPEDNKDFTNLINEIKKKYTDEVHWEINAGLNEDMFKLSNILKYNDKIIVLTDYQKGILDDVKAYYNVMDTDIDFFDNVDSNNYWQNNFNNTDIEEMIPFSFFSPEDIKEIRKTYGFEHAIVDDKWHGVICRVDSFDNKYICIYLFCENTIFPSLIASRFNISIQSLCGMGIRGKSGSYYNAADTEDLLWQRLKQSNLFPERIAFLYSEIKSSSTSDSIINMYERFYPDTDFFNRKLNEMVYYKRVKKQ